VAGTAFGLSEIGRLPALLTASPDVRAAAAFGAAEATTTSASPGLGHAESGSAPPGGDAEVAGACRGKSRCGTDFSVGTGGRLPVAASTGAAVAAATDAETTTTRKADSGNLERRIAELLFARA
jgi:hypothetical protein